MQVEAEYVGVKNVSGKDLILTHDGSHLKFAKDEVKVLTSTAGAHALGRTIFEVNKESGHTGPRALYSQIPLADALKVAKEPENKSLSAARKQKEADDKRRHELRGEILEALKAEGWEAPKKKEAKS